MREQAAARLTANWTLVAMQEGRLAVIKVLIFKPNTPRR
jgi:hypothetical protein